VGLNEYIDRVKEGKKDLYNIYKLMVGFLGSQKAPNRTVTVK
jgi:hypothetical protein